jgi:DNA-binding PadR family transcriptional regulator
MGGVRVATERGAAALRSPVSWALLGLVIQRPSYGYELVQRFERTFGDALELSSPSQIYTALDALERRALIEKLTPGKASEASRQPKPHYRATADGISSHGDWMIEQVGDERRRSRLFSLQLAVLDPQAALAILARFEQICLREASGTQTAIADDPAPHAGGHPDGHTQRAHIQRARDGKQAAEGEHAVKLASRLLREEERVSVEARLAWIGYARREFAALASGRAPKR